MLVRVDVGGADAHRTAICEGESLQAVANHIRTTWTVPPGVQWIGPIKNEKWPKDAFFFWWEPDMWETIEDALEDEHATFIAAVEVKLGEFYDPMLD